METRSGCTATLLRGAKDRGPCSIGAESAVVEEFDVSDLVGGLFWPRTAVYEFNGALDAESLRAEYGGQASVKEELMRFSWFRDVSGCSGFCGGLESRDMALGFKDLLDVGF